MGPSLNLHGASLIPGSLRWDRKPDGQYIGRTFYKMEGDEDHISLHPFMRSALISISPLLERTLIFSPDEFLIPLPVGVDLYKSSGTSLFNEGDRRSWFRYDSGHKFSQWLTYKIVLIW